MGSKEYTEDMARAVDEAQHTYEKACWGGTEKEKTEAKRAWEKAYGKLVQAIAYQADSDREVRETHDNVVYQNKIYNKVNNDPNSTVAQVEKATKDYRDAQKEYRKAEDKEFERIKAELKRNGLLINDPDSVIKSETCPKPGSAVPQEEEQDEKTETKAEKKEGESSGPLDFLGNVKIELGVGTSGRTDSQHDGARHRKSKMANDNKDQKSMQNCCTHQGQSVQCPAGLPSGSNSVEFKSGGTVWRKPDGTNVLVAQTTFPSCR
ncbi:MAG: hypothetical protein ACT4OG_06365 [Alphaproteobacteria bacterium]